MKEWVPGVFKVARQIFGSFFQAQRNAIDNGAWVAALKSHFGV